VPNQNVVNPGLVNVADQGDGPLVVDQPVTTGPGTNPGSFNRAGALAPGAGARSPDQPVAVGTPQTAGSTVQGGTYSPQSPSTANVTRNNVASQVYGTWPPAEVYP
jgi:hypothetical protein